jgi:hypothetical protein
MLDIVSAKATPFAKRALPRMERQPKSQKESRAMLTVCWSLIMQLLTE